MHRTQMSELYVRTLQAYNREPKDGELDAWLNVLGAYTYADIDAATRRWQADTKLEEFTQRPRGARMPIAAELKASIEQFNRQQAMKLAGEYVPCNQNGCFCGWVEMNAAGNKAVKRCQCWKDYIAALPPKVPASSRRARKDDLERVRP